MRAVGIVAEYNPFHKGHEYHLASARKITNSNCVVVVMSGNFVQRGQPAMFSKWQRARWALKSGADLVLELPTLYAISSAEGFAKGAITILNDLGVVDKFCFGSETNDVDLLNKLAHLFFDEPKSYKQMLHSYLTEGNTHARAKMLAASDYFDDESIKPALSSPNSILGIEYIKSKLSIGSKMQPIAIKRQSAGYHQTGLGYKMPSATAIRQQISLCGANNEELIPALPTHVFSSIQKIAQDNFAPVSLESLCDMTFFELRKLSTSGISQLGDVSEGLENRILQALSKSSNVEELLETAKTKRYPRTRLQRILMYALLGINKNLLQLTREPNSPVYARILGFNNAGQSLLKDIALNNNIDIISKPAKYSPNSKYKKQLFDLDVLASDIYALCQKHPKYRSLGQDFTTPIIKL